MKPWTAPKRASGRGRPGGVDAKSGQLGDPGVTGVTSEEAGVPRSKTRGGTSHGASPTEGAVQ